MNIMYKVMALMLLATSTNYVGAMSGTSEDTSSHTSDVSSISASSEVDSTDTASSPRLSRSRDESPTRERYGIYVVDQSYKSLTKDDISDKENFASIEIPLSVKYIDEDTFLECKNLRVVTIPVKYFNYIMPAFAKIKDQLTQIHVVGCHDKKHADRIIKILQQKYGFKKNTIIVDVEGEYTADASIPGLCCQIPVSCANYENMVIKGDNLHLVENDTFITLPNVKHITLPKSITRIQLGAFDRCHQLERITLSNDTYTINEAMLTQKGFKSIQHGRHGYVTVTR